MYSSKVLRSVYDATRPNIGINKATKVSCQYANKNYKTLIFSCWSKGLLVNKVLFMLKDHLRTEQMLLVESPQRKEVKLTLTYQFSTRSEKQQMPFNRMPLWSTSHHL